MTIHQLQSFLAVAEKQSFTAAADTLYISQSALSQQIRQLEHQLGFQLFDRSTRQVTLTEAGRSFYRNAQQLQALYAHALSEGQQLQQLSSCHIKHFCIGCLGDQFFQLWGDLFRIAMPSAEQYASRSVRYESKEALYTALLRGEAQIAALLENEDIHRIGLDFLPFARVPELCLFAPGALPVGSDPLPRIHLEELQDHLVAFHNHPGSNSYEDSLRRHLREQMPQLQFVDPTDFFTYTSSCPHFTLLLPAIQYSGHDPAVSLDWGQGHRLGFVTSPHTDQGVLEYARYIKEHLTAIPNFWEPLTE